MIKKSILVTGGLGYIGSHTTVALIERGYKVFIIDDLSNSSIDVLKRIEKITNTSPDFFKLDLTNSSSVEEFFAKNNNSIKIYNHWPMRDDMGGLLSS